jgi:hypothetical protein
MKNIQKDIAGLKHISVLVGGNEISYFKINESENNFIKILYDNGLPIFGNELSLE